MDGFANLDDFDVFQSEKGVFINNGSVEQLLDLHVEFVGGTLIGSGPCEFSRIGTRVVPNGVLQFKRAFISNPCCNEFISLAQTEFDLEPGVDQLSITGNLGRLQLEGTVNIVSNPEPDVYTLISYTPSNSGIVKTVDLKLGTVPTGITAELVEIGNTVSVVITTELLGDVNCDGFVNLLDVGSFVDAITSGQYHSKADINQDGVVDLLDVTPFVALLAGG